MTYPIIVTIEHNKVTVEHNDTPITEVYEHEERRGMVLPQNKLQRQWFKFLRKHVGYDGKLADWTRGWKCKWMVVDAETDALLSRDHTSHEDASVWLLAWILGEQYVET